MDVEVTANYTGPEGMNATKQYWCKWERRYEVMAKLIGSVYTFINSTTGKQEPILCLECTGVRIN